MRKSCSNESKQGGVDIFGDSDLKLEAALEDLESIVAALEDGRLSLEESLDLFERGVRLIKVCSARLESAEQRIESLSGELPRDLLG